MKNWKTTSTGIIMIIGAIVAVIFTKPLTQEVIIASATAVVGGLGLIFAKDNNVTGGTVEQ
jgi:hypothetical protein